MFQRLLELPYIGSSVYANVCDNNTCLPGEKILQKKCHLQSLGSDKLSEWILKAWECEGKDIAVTRTGFEMLSLKNVAKKLWLS